jgi:hypothetical protein
MRTPPKPKDIKSGRSSYSFEEFIAHLQAEALRIVSEKSTPASSPETKSPAKQEESSRQVLQFVYDVCFRSAVYSRRVRLRLDKLSKEERSVILRTIKENADNIRVLQAIFEREIADNMKKGISRQQAFKQAIQRCKAAERDAGVW